MYVVLSWYIIICIQVDKKNELIKNYTNLLLIQLFNTKNVMYVIFVLELYYS